MRFRLSARDACWATLITSRTEKGAPGPGSAGGCVQTSKHHDIYRTHLVSELHHLLTR